MEFETSDNFMSCLQTFFDEKLSYGNLSLEENSSEEICYEEKSSEKNPKVHDYDLIERLDDIDIELRRLSVEACLSQRDRSLE